MKRLSGFALLAVTVALAAVFTQQWVIEPWRCDTAGEQLLRSTLITSKMSSHYEMTARARRNIDQLRPLVERCYAVPNLYMMLALNEQLVGRDDHAAQTYRRLLEFEQRPEIYNAYATVLVRLGRYDEAVEAYLAAIRFSPARVRIEHSLTRERVRSRLRTE